MIRKFSLNSVTTKTAKNVTFVISNFLPELAKSFLIKGINPNAKNINFIAGWKKMITGLQAHNAGREFDGKPLS
ncbi:MAG: hypothetical protein K6U74_17345 [Firmicutes bacterium]|nr:hypothetical protein [Bacillota bacterium]